MMDYRETVETILSIPRFSRVERGNTVLHSYLEALGHPERGIRVIHVAGTNGKGSVCRMLCDMLERAGRRVGGFFSPHLVRMNERIRVNGEEISDEALTECYRRLTEARDAQGLLQLTFFEVLFVMALLHFQEEGVEFAVLETGMGGRLDATTAIPADLFVITQIGMDHEEYLGDTIEKVAAEKAGIITGNAPVVFHTGSPEADRVITERAERIGCKMIVNCRDAEVISEEVTSVGIDFSFRNDYDRYDHVLLPTEAVYQVENAITAVTALPFMIGDRSREDLKELVRESLATFYWEGRLEEVRPGLYVDGAHNPSAAARLAESLGRLMMDTGAEDSVLIFGASGDKNIPEVIRELGRLPWGNVILTRYPGSRAASLEELQRIAAEELKTGTKVRTAEHLQEALQMAEKNTDTRSEKKGLILVTGSLYLVGELKELLEDGYYQE